MNIEKKNLKTKFVFAFCETLKVKGLRLAQIQQSISLEWQNSYTSR